MNELRSYIKQPKGQWTIEQIQAGFRAFYNEYERYPTAHEIDAYEFLPSSRSLQRSYGGLVKIRQQLFPDEIQNYTTGEYRSKIASQTYKRAQDYEETFYLELCKQLEPIAVHEHKVIRPGGVTSDFFLYTNDVDGVCLDLFFAKDVHSFRGVINYKLKHYLKVSCPVVLVVMHDAMLTQQKMDDVIANRITTQPEHITIFSEELFWSMYMPNFCRHSKYAL